MAAPVIDYHHDDDPQWATALTVPGLPWDGTQLPGNAIPAGDGVLAMIYPGGYVASVLRVVAAVDPAALDDPAWPDYASAVAPVYTAVGQCYPGLRMLRDRDFMARLSDAARLTIAHRTTEPWQGHYSYGTRIRETRHIISISGVRVTAEGLRLRFKHRPGDTAELWEKALPALKLELRASGFTCGEPTVSQHSSGDIVLALNDQNPAENVDAPRGVTPFDAENGRSLVGVDVKSGEPVYLTWKNHAGLLVGGSPGGGKTGSTLPIIAGLVGQAVIHIFDGKGGFDYAILEPYAATFDASGDLDAPVATLKALSDGIPERAKAVHDATGKKNFWDMTPTEWKKHNLPPVFVVMDECHTWLDQTGMSPAEKKVAAEISRHVRTLILKGRFVGITVILTTQKSDATAIPTRIRDNCSNRMAFRTTTPEHSRTILGAQAAEAPDASKIPPSTPGRCVVVSDGGVALTQATWATDEDISDYLKGVCR
jgi:S-DNA-T family DNA segregation ATPase FtsK/SpoIIIE